MQEQVKEFMIINGQYPCDEGIVTLLPFRFGLIDEEVEELKSAVNFVDILDAIVDILYVGFGTLISLEAEVDDERDEFGDWQRIPLDGDMLAMGIERINTDELAAARTREEFIAATEDIIFQTIAIGRMFDLTGAFNEVHQSNLSKLGEDGKPIKNEIGKVMKGPNYKPPQLKQYTY